MRAAPDDRAVARERDCLQNHSSYLGGSQPPNQQVIDLADGLVARAVDVGV